jgi:hypothetical protein
MQEDLGKIWEVSPEEEKVILDEMVEEGCLKIVNPNESKLMSTKNLIVETFSSDSDSDKDKEAMIKACEESVLEYALKDITSLLAAFDEVDQGKLVGEVKKRFINLYAKLQAIVLIGSSTYENIDIQESRGLAYTRELGTGAVKNAIPNGKKACQIAMWSGMEEFSIDSRKMCTEEIS